MKLEILLNLGRGLPDFSEGQIVDVDAATGELLLSQKPPVARLIEADPPKIKAPAPAPAIEAVPPEVEQATEDLKVFKETTAPKRKPGRPKKVVEQPAEAETGNLDKDHTNG